MRSVCTNNRRYGVSHITLLFGVSEQTAKRWIRKGALGLTRVKVAGDYVTRKSAIRVFTEALEGTTYQPFPLLWDLLNGDDQLLEPKVAAKLLNIPVEALDKLMREGRLQPIQAPGAHRRFLQSEVQALANIASRR